MLLFLAGFATALLWRRLEARVEALEARQPDYAMPPRYDVQLSAVESVAELPEYVGPGREDDGWPGVYR